LIFVVLRVSGRIDCAYVEVLQELIETEKTAKGRLALDLKEVTVVSLEAVRALTVAEDTESNFETARPTYTNGFPEGGNADLPR
jgi:anti-anti-sigma regulatory factor